MVTVETEEAPEVAPVVLTMGVAAELLAQDGKKQAAALLLDVRRIRIQPYSDHSISVSLNVDFWAVERFSEELREEIKDAFATALQRRLRRLPDRGTASSCAEPIGMNTSKRY